MPTFELRLTSFSISAQFSRGLSLEADVLGSRQTRGRTPPTDTVLCLIPLPLQLILEASASLAQPDCGTCVLLLSSHDLVFLLWSFPLSHQPMAVMQESMHCPVGVSPQHPAGLLVGAIHWQHWEHADRQTISDLCVEFTMSIHLPHHCTSLSGLVGLFCHYMGQVLETGARIVHLVELCFMLICIKATRLQYCCMMTPICKCRIAL